MTDIKSKCHPNRKHKAKGLCGACYERHLKKINPEYKKRQMSNTTKWARENPEKMKAIYERRKLKQQSDPEFKANKRNRHLIKKYGITNEDYEVMLEEQNGNCALCFRAQGKFRLHIDHCHTTGRVRGLLCHQCNWYLGIIDADIAILDRIKEYI